MLLLLLLFYPNSYIMNNFTMLYKLLRILPLLPRLLMRGVALLLLRAANFS